MNVVTAFKDSTGRLHLTEEACLRAEEAIAISNWESRMRHLIYTTCTTWAVREVDRQIVNMLVQGRGKFIELLKEHPDG